MSQYPPQQGYGQQPVYGAAPVQAYALPPAQNWHSGLCGCFDDCGACIYSFCLCPCAMGQAKANIDGSNCYLNCCLIELTCGLMGVVFRGNVRERFMIPGSFIGDCCALCWCGPCATSQTLHETNIRKAPAMVVMAPGGGYPPQQPGYPPQQGYPQQQQGYPPQQGYPQQGYPPQQQGY